MKNLPKVRPREQLSSHIHIRLTDSDYSQIQTLAHQVNLSMSDFMRRAALRRTMPHPLSVFDLKAYQVLCQINAQLKLESLQSEVEATVPKIMATANELELPQSEIEVTVPVIPATPNKLELQLSMLPEQKSQKQQKQEQQERHQLWGNEIAPIVLTLLDSYQADSLESNNKRYQIDRFPESCDVVVQRVDSLEPVPNCTQILGFNYSKKGLKVWHNLLTQEDVEHFQAVDQQLSDNQQQLQQQQTPQQQTPQQQIWEAQQEAVQNRTIAEEIVPIAGAALEHTLLTTKTPTPAIDWKQYRISWNRQELELSITVSDGRGEILRASFEEDGTYQLPACSVTPEDVKNFQTLRAPRIAGTITLQSTTTTKKFIQPATATTA